MNSGQNDVNTYEYFKEPNVACAVAKIREALCSNFHISRNGKFAVLNVLEAKSVGHDTKLELRVMHQPEPSNESHSGIFGYTENDLEIAESLALLVKQNDLYPGDQ